jgi:hypothetical protein
MSRRPLPLAATIATLAAAAVLWPAASAAADEAESVEMQFTYGTDRSAWYWVHQIDEELALGPLSQRQELPHLQNESTLPVAVESGEPSKVSALHFDLAERGVPEGATVTRLVLTIAEGTDPGEVPTVNPAGNELVACAAADAWSPGEGDLWEAQPETTDDCVPGVREEIELEDGEESDLAPTWTFDLTALAAEWGEDPFGNHGVVFHPDGEDDGGPLDTWQINLKLPLRNDPTTPIDEYEETADRVTVELEYVPGDSTEEEIDETAPEDSPVDASGAGGSTEAPPDDDFAGTGGSSGGGSAGSDGLDDFDEGEIDEAAMADHDQNDQAVPVASREPFVPAMPWYAWLLIPAVLLATMLVRGALVEPSSATRPNGVIATIRQRNALRRGSSLPVKPSLASRLMVALSFGRGASST